MRLTAHEPSVLLMLAMCVSGLAALPARAPAQVSQPPSATEEWTYTVRPGDNLWDLSREYLESVAFGPRLQRLNRITDPLRLSPGTRLRVPFAWMKTQPAAARVVEARGRAEITRGGETGSVPLTPGLLIGPGDALTTGADGSVSVDLADGSRFLLGANGRVVFDVLSAFGPTGMVDTRLRLERGRTRARVTPRRGRFRIWTPAAATVVRGTEFRAEFDADERTARTEVTSGAVETAAEAAAVEVNEGFGTTAREGDPPGPPVALLPMPEVGAEPRVARRLPVRIEVPPIRGAVSHRLEIAPDAQFLSFVFEGESATGEFRALDLPDGTYAFRVRGIDERGLQGLDAIASLIVDARPEPPVLMTPDAGAVLQEERPTFSWSRPAGAAAYRFQLVPDGSLEAPVVDVVLDAGASFTVGSALSPGRYTWRVATRSADGEEGPFGDWQSFTRRPPPAVPTVGPPRHDAGVVTLSWSVAEEGSRYSLQLARDPQFTDLVLEQTVSSAEARLERPAPGRYFLRVRAIGPDGFESEFGPAQSFDIEAPPPPRKTWPWRRLLLPAVPVVLVILLL